MLARSAKRLALSEDIKHISFRFSVLGCRHDPSVPIEPDALPDGSSAIVSPNAAFGWFAAISPSVYRKRTNGIIRKSRLGCAFDKTLGLMERMSILETQGCNSLS
jgi:hypothetical protein